MAKMPLSLGITHYDPSPPERISDVAELLIEDRFREARSAVSRCSTWLRSKYPLCVPQGPKRWMVLVTVALAADCCGGVSPPTPTNAPTPTNGPIHLQSVSDETLNAWNLYLRPPNQGVPYTTPTVSKSRAIAAAERGGIAPVIEVVQARVTLRRFQNVGADRDAWIVILDTKSVPMAGRGDCQPRDPGCGGGPVFGQGQNASTATIVLVDVYTGRVLLDIPIDGKLGPSARLPNCFNYCTDTSPPP
jgi:hypothetical protein